MFPNLFRPRLTRLPVLRLEYGLSARRISSQVTADIRTQLTTELKSAMKNKDSLKSTVVRSVLAEIYAADKVPGRSEPVSSSAILGILRKAVLRRTDSAAEFEKASRSDLAQKEKAEAELLQVFLPPLLPRAEIDRVLGDVLSGQPELAEANSRKTLGLLLKSFYAQVDRSSVDTNLVRQRAEALLSG